jgi:hypothetical protein
MATPLLDFEGQIRGRVDAITNAARMRDAQPAEVHAELTEFCRQMVPHVRGSANHFGDAAWGARMQATLAELPQRETAEYARRMGIVLPDTSVSNAAAPQAQAAAPAKKSSVFANAKATSKDQPWRANAETYKQVYTFSCVHCGAPQQVELNFVCKFCGKTVNK